MAVQKVGITNLKSKEFNGELCVNIGHKSQVAIQYSDGKWQVLLYIPLKKSG